MLCKDDQYVSYIYLNDNSECESPEGAAGACRNDEASTYFSSCTSSSASTLASSWTSSVVSSTLVSSPTSSILFWVSMGNRWRGILKWNKASDNVSWVFEWTWHSQLDWGHDQHCNISPDESPTCGQSPASSCLGRSSPQRTGCRVAPSSGPAPPGNKVIKEDL